MMNLGSRLTQRLLSLPPPLTRDLVVQRDLRVPMRDGIVLLADRWAPKGGGDGLPTALLRTPYGRAGLAAGPMVKPLAERGFQVLIESARGTFGSGGVFDPLRQEREDGLDTLDWVIEQPWFGESMVLFGTSYLGFVQWAVADRLPPQVKAMVPSVSESALTLEFLREDGFSLETPFGWGVLIAGQEQSWAMPRQLLGAKRVRRAMDTLPLSQADVAAIGHRFDYIQDILAHDADSPHWAPADHSRRAVNESPCRSARSAAGTTSSCPANCATSRPCSRSADTPGSRSAPGRTRPGAWESRRAPKHSSSAWRMPAASSRPSVPRYACSSWASRPGTTSLLAAARIPAAALPPPAGGALALDEPGESAPDGYRYDPADPTPAVGGVRLALGVKAGSVDNTKLEARPDVLTYTTAVLDTDVEVIGEVSAEIWFRSSLQYADVFVRLCDVDENGRSVNVCDGLVSLTDADQISRATVRLWPTAYRFGRGHRIRVQVSSGAFPRYNRNPGTGEPRATAADPARRGPAGFP
jgi:predicted acyl esterase